MSFRLRSMLGIALAGAMLSLAAAPAANARVWVGGHYWGGHYWGGPHVVVGFGCCWGSPYYWPAYYPYYYPYPAYTPYVSYPIDGDVGGVSLASPYVQQALAAPIGQSIEWTNGDTHGAVATMRDGWAGENYCREFRQDVTIGGQTRQAVGTACHAPNGNWRLVPNQP